MRFIPLCGRKKHLAIIDNNRNSIGIREKKINYSGLKSGFLFFFNFSMYGCVNHLKLRPRLSVYISGLFKYVQSFKK